MVRIAWKGIVSQSNRPVVSDVKLDRALPLDVMPYY